MTNNNIKVDFKNKRVKLPKIKSWIRYRDDRKFSEGIKHVTVSKTKSGKYFVSILIERELSISPIMTIPMNKIEAFDMSTTHFLVSESIQLKNPWFYRKVERKLKKLHRSVSRKEKGSNNRDKARIKLARLHEKINNRKLDWVHKAVNDLCNKYDGIILEDLNIAGMQKFNSGVSKSVTLDFSWNQFINILGYKMQWQGKHLSFVYRFYPSSKLCSVCGYKNDALTLNQRTWTCPECGTHHDRDKNASANLKTEGITLLEAQAITII